ncbi:ribosome maturation factor RimP [Desulfosarcina sp. OttesenSCG-928-A07]|nr:ribosome maturation factor RimP [Desulfosarcina sp. OttesenSCG-928-G17]MDL2328719.1 ribosome maturation factor RimP [Desulfosarcina sp. OttesenSCG-928-A07]
MAGRHGKPRTKPVRSTANGSAPKKSTAPAPSSTAWRDHQRAVIASVTRLVESLCGASGIELVHVEYQREPGGLTLRIYLDQPGGITLDDCVDMNRKLGDILDVHVADLPPYQLEVSSPGINRPLGKLSDFDRFRGHHAKIRMVTAVGGRKNFTGILAGIAGEMIRLEVDGKLVELNYNDVVRARLDMEISL